MGTSDKVVCRVLGGSDKCDALAIAAAYKRKYGTVLKDGIRKECSGNYKRIAQAWVTLPDALADPDEPIEIPPDEPLQAEVPMDPADELSSDSDSTAGGGGRAGVAAAGVAAAGAMTPTTAIA